MLENAFYFMLKAFFVLRIFLFLSQLFDRVGMRLDKRAKVSPLSVNPTKWSNTLKQFFGKLPTNCLSVFDHFVKLALKGLVSKFMTSQIENK